MDNKLIDLRLRANLIKHRNYGLYKRLIKVVPKAQEEALELRSRQLIGMSTLASTLLIALMMNMQLSLSQNATVSKREIASVSPIETINNEDKSVVIQRLATPSERNMASVGDAANEIDKLKFEFFEGKYSFRYEDGKVVEIEHSYPGSSTDRPKYVEDPAEFLKTHNELFAFNFKSPVKQSQRVESDKVVSIYSLVNDESHVVAEAKWVSDSNGRVVSVSIVPLRARTASSRTSAGLSQ